MKCYARKGMALFMFITTDRLTLRLFCKEHVIAQKRRLPLVNIEIESCLYLDGTLLEYVEYKNEIRDK